MPVKPDGKPWTVKEQIIEDLVTGLTFQFEVMPDGEMRLRIFGRDVPFGNREFFFDSEGVEAGSGGVTQGHCRPAWMENVAD